MEDFLVVLRSKLVNGQESLLSVETEVALVIVGKVPGVGVVTNDEKLDKRQEGLP